MKKLFVLLAAVLLFGLHQSARAALITYNLSNVTFTDGATATGSFDYDGTTANGGTFGNFDITTTDGNGDGTTGYHFTTTNSTVIGDQSAFVFGSNDITGNVLYLFTFENITGPGSFDIIPGPNQSGEVAPVNVRDISGGNIVSAGFNATPEPSGVVSIAIALALLIGLAFRCKIQSLTMS